jgi:elongator complex protein 2
MRYESLFTCGAASTISHGLLWIEAPVEGAKKNFVVYAVHNLVAVLDLNSKTVVGTLRGCTGCITSISHCQVDDTVALVVACDDGSVKMCYHRGAGSLLDWSPFQALEGLVASASALHCIVLDNNILVSAADSKGSVVAWLCEPSNSTSKVIAQFKLPSAQMSKTVHFAELPSVGGARNIALFVGSVDARVHIYVATKESIGAASSADWDRAAKAAVFTSAGAVPGHEEWVTCLSSLATDSKGMYLASGSQDSKIRVWNIKAMSASAVSSAAAALAAVDLSAELDVENEAVEGEVIVESNEDETESEARLLFSAGGVQYAVLLESLLVGHEDWVTSVQWMPSGTSSTPEGAIEYRLFSTSMDRNMVIWSPDASAGGVWVPKVRMGDIGGALGGMIGGNLLGFVGGATSPRGDALIGVGYGGSFHLWEQQQSGEEAGRWAPVPLSSGHFASVNDLCWSDDLRGDYLTTVSADQTCRIFAPLQRAAGGSLLWKEISRPQIHGYDLNCVVQAPRRGAHTLYTAGEEKLIRVFDAPNSVLRGLEKLCGITMNESASTSR